MATFENTIKWLGEITPDIKFKNALQIANDYQETSDNYSNHNYVVLLLMQMIGVDSNGHWPDSFKKMAIDNIEFAYAMEQAGKSHGGHSCGIPGYEISMDDYKTKFIYNMPSHNKSMLTQRQADYKEILKPKP